MNYKRYIKILLLGCFCMVSLAGCNKEKVQYIDDTDVNTDTDSSTTMLKEELQVEERWEETIKINNTNIVIDAELTIPEISNVSVIEANAKVFQPEERKAVMDTFSQEIYYYGGDYYTKSELDDLIKQEEEKIEKMKNSEIYEADQEFALGYIEVSEDVIEKLREGYDDATEEHVVATDFSYNSFLIKYNGLDYIFRFDSGYDKSNSAVMYSSVTMELANYYDMYDNPYDIEENGFQFEIHGVYGSVESTDNLCQITVEDAKEVAVDFLNQMDVGRFEVVREQPLYGYHILEGNPPENWNNGYVFVFHRKVNEMKVDGEYIYKNNYNYLSEQALKNKKINGIPTTEMNYGLEEIVLYVNDIGVIKMEYYYPLELGETIASDVNLLEYAKIKDAFINELDNLLNGGSDLYASESYIKFTNLDFVYFPLINYEGNTYKLSLIPAWRLSDKEIQTDKIPMHFIVINAMDGSVINVGNRIYKSIEISDWE